MVSSLVCPAVHFSLRSAAAVSWNKSVREEMSFQVSLENCQGFSIPDGGGLHD